MAALIKKMPKTVQIIIFCLIAIAVVLLGIINWLGNEDACWKGEAEHAFRKYGSCKSRSDVLRVVMTTVGSTENQPDSNPLEVFEKEPNACSIGSSGLTVIWFTFDTKDNLKKIQVFRDYVASDYKMDVIDEKDF